MTTPDENIGVLEAARAIAAGRRVDWAAIESSADISESLAALLRELKVVEDIAELHRSLPDTSASAAASSASSIATETVAAAAETATWGSLRLLERVGQGAFGDVYRAWDPRLDREIALKLLKRLDDRDDAVGSLVIDEGRLLARVRHPNVVTVYGADRIDGRVGLWMEFVRGRTLEAVLRDHGPFSAQEAALIGLDLCRALSAVHRAGLVHRDIKAHNVMREAGGRIVLMDFGTGREDLGDHHAELAGTPLYLAPEVFAGATATPRSDIYSAGVLLYHLATGSYPVKGRNVGDLRIAHEQRRRSWLRDDRPDLPDRFVQAVERALDFDPAQRFETAGAMEAALARVVSAADAAPNAPIVDVSPTAIPLSTPTIEGSYLAAPRASGTGRKVPRPAWVAAALAAAAAVGIALVPAAWRARLLGGHGGSPPAQSAAAALSDSPIVVRRVSLPGTYQLVGAPSFDGSLFSMVADDGNVAVIDLAANQMRRVTSDAVLEKDSQFAEFTAIAADNQFVAYAWQALDGKYELRVVDMEGKRPRVLVRSDSLDYPVPIQWTRDGKFILATLTRTDRTVQLALVSAQDGAVRTLKETARPPQYASVSPRGDFVVYDAPQEASANSRDIFIVGTDGSNDHRLIEHPANDANPVWTPDGQRVLFASDRSGTMDVWSVAVAGGFAQGEPQLVHRNIGKMWLRGLTDTGRYFYYATVGQVEVYQAELTANGVKNIAPIAPTYAGSNISSIWSADGRRVAYTSRRGLVGFDRGSSTLAVRDVATGEQHEVVPAMNGFLVRSWSPDGRYVLVGGNDAAGNGGHFAIDVDSGVVKPIVGGARPDWRPDGRVVYLNRAKGTLVARNVETGVDQVLEDLRAEGINAVGDVNGRGLKLSPDGQTLAYSNATRSDDVWTRSISVKPLGAGSPRELVRVTGPEMILFQDWMPDGQSVLFTRWTAKPNEPFTLWRVSIYGGDPQPLGLSMPGIRDLSVHPGGTKITFTAGWPLNELWVMENFLTDK